MNIVKWKDVKQGGVYRIYAASFSRRDLDHWINKYHMFFDGYHIAWSRDGFATFAHMEFMKKTTITSIKSQLFEEITDLNIPMRQLFDCIFEERIVVYL